MCRGEMAPVCIVGHMGDMWEVCGRFAEVRVPEGWGIAAYVVYKSPPCPTSAPCRGSGAYH